MVSVNHVYQDSSAAGVFKHQRSERSSKRLSEDGDLLSLTFKKDQGGGIGGVRRQKRNVMYRYLYRQNQNRTMGGIRMATRGRDPLSRTPSCRSAMLPQQSKQNLILKRAFCIFSTLTPQHAVG